MKDLRRIVAYIRHRLTSWNTGGEGVHSPYLFELVRMVIYDENRYYCWQDIENRRYAMLHAPKLIQVTDYGTGQSGERLVKDIAKRCLCSRKEGEILFRLANFLREKAEGPITIVELGTSLGISTAYLAMADSRSKVVTFEGSEAIAEMARTNWKKLGIENVACVVGNIDETLGAHAPTHANLIYIDANHTCEATLRYVRQLMPAMGQQSIMVLDDIHLNEDMEQAWEEVKQMKEVTSTFDFYRFGLVFVDPHYLVKHYRMRL